MEFLIVVLLLAIGLGVWAMSIYNGFVRLRNLIQESWRQIDVELNRRYELIPNLVETVRGFAAHERNTLEEVTRLRNMAASLSQSGASAAQRAQAEEELSGAIRGLMVSVEAYPDLKSNVNFLELQRELTDTEDRVAAGRRFYNANVRDYNTKVETVPSNLIASFAKFEKATYFEVSDPAVRQAPSVNFGEISQRPGGPAMGHQMPGQPLPYGQQGGYQAPGYLNQQTPGASIGQYSQQPPQGYPQQGYAPQAYPPPPAPPAAQPTSNDEGGQGNENPGGYVPPNSAN